MLNAMKRVLTLLLVVVYFVTTSSCTRTEEDHRWVLEQLRQRFRDVRANVQYAALYVPPPNSPRNQMVYIPSPRNNNMRYVLYPVIRNRLDEYPHNYAAASPDVDAREYGPMMDRAGYTLHTEALLLTLAYNVIESWYNIRFGIGPRFIYLFTHFLPCERCRQLIQEFQEAHQNIRVYVGYTNLYGGAMEGNNAHLQRATRQRRDELESFLENSGGGLFQLATAIQGVCAERGIDVAHAGKRDVLETCPASTKDRMFIITMDFSTGRVVAEFTGIQPFANGWIGLYDERENLLTYKYTRGISSGKISFNVYIYDGGLYIRYFQERYEPVLSSLRWNACGFDWVNFNYEDAYSNGPATQRVELIKLTVKRGYPLVTVYSNSSSKFDSNDWIAIQSFDQVGTHNYWTWQWVSSMSSTTNGERYHWFDKAINSKLAQGFRAKYIPYLPGEGYYWGDTYSRATPLWIPGQCMGTEET